MSLFKSYGETESPFIRVGDKGFIGMDARTAPDKLPEGVYALGENIRCRTGEAMTREGNPFISWFYPDHYPYDQVYSNPEIKGTWSASSGGDVEVEVTLGATTGTPYSSGYTYLRFIDGSGAGVVVKATGNQSGSTIPVDPQFVANSYDPVNESFVWVKQTIGDASLTKWLTRSVITQASTAQTVVTSGTFRDPNSNDYAVIATTTSTWFGREYNRPVEVTVPGGITDTGYLLQCFEKLLLFRGTTQTVLEYSTATNAWAEITATTSGDYTLALPNAKRGIFFQNRVWVHVGDYVYFSDIGQYTRYYWLENEVRINVGENDDIVALFPFGKYALLIFKEHSIHMLDNLYGDVAANMRLRQISSRIGCGAAETITNVGNRVWFCDKNGAVWDLNQVDEERMELSGEPISWPIEPLWNAAGAKNISTWAAAYHNNYFYLFMAFEPSSFFSSVSILSGYTNLNRTAVYDTIKQAWCSIDYDAGSRQNNIGKPMYLDWMGEPRLMMVDKVTGNLQVIGYGEADGTSTLASQANLVTRGYTADPNMEQQFARVNISVNRLDGTFYAWFRTDGEVPSGWKGDQQLIVVNASDQIIYDTTDRDTRLTYLTANETTGYVQWDPTNVNADFENPYRGDYSVYLGDNTASGTAAGMKIGTVGIPTTRYQNYKYVQMINELGNYAQIKISNLSGSMKLKSVSVSSRKNMNLQGERV